MKFKGLFVAKCFKNGKLVWEDVIKNLITDQGINYILNTSLTGLTAVSTLYLIPFETNYTPLAVDTYASKGFVESQTYNESIRQAYTISSTSTKSFNNTNYPAVMVFNAVKTIYGLAVVGGSSIKGDSAASEGILLAAGKFDSSKALTSGKVLSLTYTITGSSS